MKKIFLIMSLLMSFTTMAECPDGDYSESRYLAAKNFLTSLNPTFGLGNCSRLELPPVEDRKECNVWSPKKFRGYSYFFVLPYHEKFGPQGHYLMIGEDNTQTVWTVGTQNRGDFFTTRITRKVEFEIDDETLSWEFKQGLHLIRSTLKKDADNNLVSFQAQAWKRGLFNSEYKEVYNTICE